MGTRNDDGSGKAAKTAIDDEALTAPLYACAIAPFRIHSPTMKRVLAVGAVLSLVGLSFLSLSCNRSKPTKSSSTTPAPSTNKDAPTAQPKTTVSQDLQKDVDVIVQAVETLDVPKALAGYTDDYRSGTGRSKDGVREVLTKLQEGHVHITVEKTEIEEASADKAKLKTQLRLRYKDTFRDMAEGEVVVTDTLRHFLRKEEGHWRIYTDERISTYREGRFGEQSPNIQLDVPGKLPPEADYAITVSVQRDPDKNYQVMVGNYPEDPEFLPPPDIVTELPENGVLTANLVRNPKGRSEMVRITVIVEDQEGNWVGTTTVSKFVPGLQKGKEDEEDQAVI